MPLSQVLVRDIDPQVMDRLEARARQHGRSLEAELRLILAAAAQVDRESPPVDLESVRSLFTGRHFSDSSELIREDRAR